MGNSRPSSASLSTLCAIAALALAAPALAKPTAKAAAPAGFGSQSLFDFGLVFKHAGQDARVWAHKSCKGQTCPLMIFLHGSNKPPVWVFPAMDERVPNPAPDKKFMVHVGKLAQKMIDDGLVTPLVIAVPTDGGTGTPWGSLDLKQLVNDVVSTVSKDHVKIDLDSVGVVGHSAGGGYPGRGLDRIAEQKATFDGHKLKVFGITDTNITLGTAQKYAKLLKDNDTTAIYALHKMGGGWVTYDSGVSNTMFGKGLGAEKKVTSLIGNEKAADLVGTCLDNGGATPLRMTCKINFTKINAYHAAWEAAGGYKTRPDKAGEYHNDMVPMWAWWALPRLFPK
jgi:hypothetical protein